MTDTWAAKVLEGVPRYNPGGCGNSVWLHVDDALAAIARMGAGDGLVEQATAALEGVTDGPWSVPGQPDKICTEGYTRNGMAKTIATVSTPAWMGDAEPWANARFIAFTRQWVPEAAARISALTAHYNIMWEANLSLGFEKKAAEARISELVEGCNQLEVMARDYAEEAAELRAKVARLEVAGDFARLIGNDGGKDDKDTVLVSYGMLRRLRAALTDGGK